MLSHGCNSFVIRSVTQYFRDIHRTCIHDVANENIENLEDITNVENTGKLETAKSKIHPVPVLFTDRYRWFLRREDAASLSPRYETPIFSSDSSGPESVHIKVGRWGETPIFSSDLAEPESMHDGEGGWGRKVVTRDTKVLEFDLSCDDLSLYTNTK
jgi:hypothetical protein